MKKLLQRIAVAVVVTLSLIAAVEAPAQAAPEPKPTAGVSAGLDNYTCHSGGWICLFDSRCCFQDPYRYVIVDSYSAPFCFNIPAEWDNRVDVVVNRGNNQVSFYTGNYCSGAPLDPSRFYPQTTTAFAAHDANEANSMRFH